MKNFSMKRFTASLLMIVMILTALPASLFSFATDVRAADASAQAEGETIYVLAGGDFQEADDPGDHANSAANVTNILAQIGQKYTTMDGFLFIGDYDCETHDSATETAAGITALMGAVQGKYSNLNDSNSVLAQGNHDYRDSRIDATGGHDIDANGDGVNDYSAYVLNEDDYPNGGGSQNQIQTLANNLKTWLNGKIGEGYSAPIFIVSHLPLAYTPRTITQGDAKYAKYIVDVLNDAGANGLNIIFLHGHDHAYGPDNYMGGEAIYLPKGDTLYVADPTDPTNSDKKTAETLNFTYMNAGYTGYYSDPFEYDGNVVGQGTDKLTMTVFAITDNKVTVERYSANGLYNLKSAGYNGSYSNTSVTNETLGLPLYDTVYASPQTITLEDNDAADMGTIGEWVAVNGNAGADDVKPSNNGWVEIIPPVPGTFTEDVRTYGDDWTTLTEPSDGETIFKLTDRLSDGNKYVIVNRNTKGSGNATNLNNNNSIGSVTVEVISDSNGTYIKAPATTAQWNYYTNKLQNVNNTRRYLRGNSSNLGTATNTNDSYTTWSYDNSSYGLRASPNYGSTYRYMTSVTKTSTSSSTTNRVYIYVEDSLPGSNGLYAYLKGDDLRYTITAGMDADAALQMVKDGIDIQYATAADYSDEQNYPDNGEGITWTLDPNYDPDVPGDYAVTVKYNGKTIGVAEVIVPAKADVNGTWYKIVDDTNNNFSYDLTDNASEVMAEDAVKAGVTVYKYEGMSAPGTSTAGTAVSDSDVTWTLDSNYSGTTAGDYAVTITKDGKTLGTAEVVVPASTKYYVAEGNGLYLVDMNTTETNAMAAVKAGVTVYSASDANGNGKTAISDDDVTWEWVDKYNGADSGPFTVEILKNGTSLGTVEVKVNVKYETGINTDWTYIGETEATGGSHTYTLDTDGIDYGEENKYIIVDDNEAIVLNANSSSNGTAHSITISGNTATLDTRDYEYHMIRTTYNGNRYELITKGDGSQYLYQESNGVRYGTRTSVKFQVNHHGSGVYDIHDIDGTNWYIIYNGSWTVTETTSARVRLYKYTGTTGGTAAGSVYALIEGNTVYTVEQGTSATRALAAVKAGITGYIANNANGTDKTEIKDSDLTWKWKNTFNANSTGSYWVEISYEGKVLGTVEVKVEPGSTHNYPEYPDEGAVKVSKTAIGVDFQSTGVAQVEVSASGVPSKKGVDVVVMLDTSSSMESWCVCGKQNCSTIGTGHARRSAVLEESLSDLVTLFTKPGDDGQLLDIDIAIADFNGFYGENHNASGTPYDRDAADMMSDDIYYDANSEAKIYTGTGLMDAGAFISVEDLAASYTLNYTSGTNYDYAMDAIYQLATAKKEANGSEDRDLYVIFLSDGAPMQWNYYHSQGPSSLWNNWITGTWTANQLTTTNINCTTHAYYYDEVDHDGDGQLNEHRMANAIKGDPTEQYEVIRKTDTLGTPTGETNMYHVPGLGATMFAISFGAQDDGKVTKESMHIAIDSIATPDGDNTTPYHYHVTTADELTNAFNSIGNEIAYAAYNARFVDQMGGNYNLQMAPITDFDGNPIYDANGNQILPSIQIISYDIYTRQDYKDGKCTEDQIGVRKGTFTVLETVTFESTKNDDGTYTITGAFSDKIGGGTTNILADDTQEGYVDGVIYAKTFYYNTNSTGVALDGVNIPTGKKADGTTTGSTNVLPSESFYWKMGTVQTSELAMRYYVYLEGSMEGTRPAGSYNTNEFAILYYDNYLGNPCYKDTTSPVLAWESANVSYAFYLVNKDGQVIVNKTTGETGTFANKIAVTRPVVYEEILLNNTDQVQSIDVSAISDDVLPRYYTLYDEGAVYEITINSDSSGQWKITKGNVTANSTYVTHYTLGTDYSNALTENNKNYDYTHTTVWFAVVWKIQAHPDSVVIDYGLPVDISVLSNDMFGDHGKLAGIGSIDNLPNGYDVATDGDDTLAAGFATSYTGAYGTAKADLNTGMVRYTLDKEDGMQMETYEKFAYAVNYTGSTNSGYYYDTVTVIPATSIYYEETFVSYHGASNAASGYGVWTDEGKFDETLTQDEDRPGQYSLADHNNLYGYDSINLSATTYSLGSAKKVTVNSKVGYHKDNSPYATFTFKGTGFDIISMTNSDSGAIFVEIKDAAGNPVRNVFVDNYYGYAYDEESKSWTPAPSDSSKIYQVPVIKIDGLTYGEYTVTIRVTWGKYFEHSGDESYSFWLDSIRIYDPAGDVYSESDTNNDSTIKDAYVADGETYPKYLTIRDAILPAKNADGEFVNGEIPGVVFIDGIPEANSSVDYANPGPNNEVYLAPGQSISFKLQANAKPLDVQIGVKLASGSYAKVCLDYTVDRENDKTASVSFEREFTTATDMYYSIINRLSNEATETDKQGGVAWETGTITFTNITDKGAIVSLTSIKATFDTSTGISAAPVYPETNGNGGEDPAAYTPDSTEPVSINFLVDSAVIKAGCEAVRKLYSTEPEVFTPEVFEHVLVTGLFQTSNLHFITSKDVAAITVNGTAAKLVSNPSSIMSELRKISGFKTKFANGATLSDYNVWTVKIKKSSTYEVVAKDSKGIVGEPIVISALSGVKTNNFTNYIKTSTAIDTTKFREIMDELSSRTFVPETFGVYVNNRADGQRDVIARTSEDVQYVIVNGEIVNRYITETVVDADGETLSVNRVWIADSANASVDSDITVNAYDENGVGSEARNANGIDSETSGNESTNTSLTEDDIPSAENFWNIWRDKAGRN